MRSRPETTGRISSRPLMAARRYGLPLGRDFGRIEVEVVDAVGLGDLGPALGQGPAGETVRFQHPGELGLLDAPLDRLGHDAVHEHQSQPLHLVLGQHVGRDQADLLDLALLAQEMDEAEGEEPAVDLLDPRVVVQQPEACPDQPPVDLHEDGQFGHDEELQGLGDVLHFARRTWERSPRCSSASGCRSRGTS